MPCHVAVAHMGLRVPHGQRNTTRPHRRGAVEVAVNRARALRVVPTSHGMRTRSSSQDKLAQGLGSRGRHLLCSAVRGATAASAWESQYGKPLDFGVSADQGLRDEMEDVAALVPRGVSGYLYACVKVAQYLAENLYSKVCAEVEHLGTDAENLSDYLPRLFEELDAEILDWLQSNQGKQLDETGSTATCVLARKDRVIVANVGDSRAVLSRNGRAIDLSTEHRAYGKGKIVKLETARIESVGGWVKGGRVCDMLAVTRAFGDAEFKGDENRAQMLQDGIRDGYWSQEFADSVKWSGDPVVATPDVSQIEITEEDEFMIIASDGLWDVYTSAEAISFVRREYRSNKKAQDIADELVARALSRRTQDNVVCIIVILNKFDADVTKTIKSRKSGMFGMF
eukprot:jgi/Tetstr1/420682/TSEL_011768.t1